jgi:TldD protein
MARQPEAEALSESLARALDDASSLAARAGAPHWEVRAEAMQDHAFEFDGKEVRNSRTTLAMGVGVRVILRGASGYAFSTDLGATALQEAVRSALALAEAAPPSILQPAGKPGRVRDRPPTMHHPRDAGADDRLALARRAHAAAASDDIVHTLVFWGESWGQRLIRTSDGGAGDLEPLMTGLTVMAVAKGPQGAAGSVDYAGGARGLGDYAEGSSPEALGANAARYAREQARASKAPAGRTRALIDPTLAGVLAHESFGHLAEHDLVDSGWSILRGREGQRMASEAVTIVDTGLLPSPRGGTLGVRLAVDEEAVPTRPVALVERGVLRGFLHSRLTASAAGVEPTGNARAVDYRFPPICRMRNTYFQPGEMRLDEALEEVRDGVYACGSTGGEARSDGNFLFSLTRAYRVEKGEVGEPLKEASITGNIVDFLQDVTHACRELDLATSVTGGCAKWGQWPCFVGFGGPHLVLKEALLGGQEVGRGD